MSDIKVTAGGVLKLLQKLSPSKATGPDMLPARILKKVCNKNLTVPGHHLPEKLGYRNYPKRLEDFQRYCDLQEGRNIQSQQLQASLPYMHLLQGPGTHYYK